jgi:hypothetical protein
MLSATESTKAEPVRLKAATRVSELVFGSVGWQLEVEFWASVKGFGASEPVRSAGISEGH